MVPEFTQPTLAQSPQAAQTGTPGLTDLQPRQTATARRSQSQAWGRGSPLLKVWAAANGGPEWELRSSAGRSPPSVPWAPQLTWWSKAGCAGGPLGEALNPPLTHSPPDDHTTNPWLNRFPNGPPPTVTCEQGPLRCWPRAEQDTGSRSPTARCSWAWPSEAPERRLVGVAQWGTKMVVGVAQRGSGATARGRGPVRHPSPSNREQSKAHSNGYLLRTLLILLRYKMTVYLFFKILFNFNWRITALQYCVGFCHPSTWIRHRSTHVPFLLKLLPTPYIYIYFINSEGVILFLTKSRSKG